MFGSRRPYGIDSGGQVAPEFIHVPGAWEAPTHTNNGYTATLVRVSPTGLLGCSMQVGPKQFFP